jgi:hypothetical protein
MKGSMNLLASAIPGLRAIRAPLIAGYLWLLVAWLHFDPSPGLRDETGVVGEIVDLADTVGPIATAAGVSVGAYLLGSLSVGLFGRVLSVLRDMWVIGVGYYLMSRERRARNRHIPPDIRREPPKARRDDRPSPTRQTLSNLYFVLMPRIFSGAAAERRERKHEERTLERLSELRYEAQEERHKEWIESLPGRDQETQDDASSKEPVRSNLDRQRRDKEVRDLLSTALPVRLPTVPEIRDELAQVWPKMQVGEYDDMANGIRALRRGLKSELKLPATILVGEQTGVFAEADRLRAEAEFRFAIGPPLVALVWQLATETTAWCWALLIVPYLLYSQGQGYARSSEFLIGQARERNQAASPALERFQRRVNEIVAAHRADSTAERAPAAAEPQGQGIPGRS